MWPCHLLASFLENQLVFQPWEINSNGMETCWYRSWVLHGEIWSCQRHRESHWRRTMDVVWSLLSTKWSWSINECYFLLLHQLLENLSKLIFKWLMHQGVSVQGYASNLSYTNQWWDVLISDGISSCWVRGSSSLL